MRPDEYWKNFNLGTELDIAGRFLYNGLRTFHEMKNFASEEDAFEFLYNLAVGVERILKIAVILTEHDEKADQNAFEESLITHSHQELVRRLKKNHQIDLAPVHNEFISILSKFYKSHRYGRYSLASIAAPAQEREDLVAFLEKYLSTKIDTKSMFGVTINDRQYRKFMGRVVSKIVLPVFEIIKTEARRLNLYTYEIEYLSKASKIFQRQSFDFEDEDILQVELMAYFISDEACGPNARLIRDLIKPLPFDPALESDYLDALRSDRSKLLVLDELESHYEEIQDHKERLSLVEAATISNLSYGEDDEGSGEDEE